ncbi:MAG: pilus assembly protein TadG-related protein [Actinomycetota bacterium]
MTGRSLHRDERGINRSFLLVVILLAIVGVLIVDGGSILFATVQLQDAADLAATDAASVYEDTHSQTQACQAAERVIEGRDSEAEIVGGCSSKGSKFFVATATGAVSLIVRKEATTVVLGRIDAFKSWTSIEVTGRGTPSVL